MTQDSIATPPPHPTELTVNWTPDDFDAAVEQALALVREDTATVIDIGTRAVIR